MRLYARIAPLAGALAVIVIGSLASAGVASASSGPAIDVVSPPLAAQSGAPSASTALSTDTSSMSTSVARASSLLEPALSDATANGSTPAPGGAQRIAAAKIKWIDASGYPLFGNKAYPALSDVHQGGLGDCYFLAGVGARVARSDEYITDDIYYNYGVTGKVVSVTVHIGGKFVTMKPTLPVASSGAEVYAAFEYSGAGGDVGTWAAFYEKAYATIKGGYAKIGNGGRPDLALQDITNTAENDVTLGKLPSSDFGGAAPTTLMQAQYYFNQGYAMVIDTSKSSTALNVFGGHAYTVTGFTKSSSGVLEIKLSNPWGFDQPVGPLTNSQFVSISDGVEGRIGWYAPWS